MPDDIGTETIRSDAPSAEDSPFAYAVEDTAAVETAGEQEPTGEPAQDPQVPDDGDEPDAGEDAAQDAQDSDDGDKPDAETETDAADELKVVVSIKGSRAVIGVQQPSSDPYIETFEDHDLPRLAQEVVALTERARARWEEAPKHPAYERPAPPAKRRNNRRQQGATQDGNAEGAAEQEQAQQTLRLF